MIVACTAFRCTGFDDTARANTASAIPPTGTPRPTEFCTVQTPVPLDPAWSTMTSTSGFPVAASSWRSTSAVISMRYDSRSPPFHSSNTSAMASGSWPPTRRSRSKDSAMSCMSAYSMPLWIIFTKWPAPSVPMWVTQGLPSATAAIDSRIGPSVSYASAVPPGMMLGPLSAPSSPPEMPAPTKWRPFARTSFSRRIVSVNSALPPSTMMSPSSNASVSCSMTASVPRPALTMMIAVRGRCSDAANSSIEVAATKPASGCSSTRSVVFWVVRLYTATVLPSRLARLRARFDPITASPTTPMFAVACWSSDI